MKPLQEEISRLVQELKPFADKMHQIDFEIKTKSKEITTTNRELSKLADQISTATSKSVQYGAQLSSVNRQIEELKTKLTTVQGHITEQEAVVHNAAEKAKEFCESDVRVDTAGKSVQELDTQIRNKTKFMEQQLATYEIM